MKNREIQVTDSTTNIVLFTAAVLQFIGKMGKPRIINYRELHLYGGLMTGTITCMPFRLNGGKSVNVEIKCTVNGHYLPWQLQQDREIVVTIARSWVGMTEFDGKSVTLRLDPDGNLVCTNPEELKALADWI